MQPWAEMAYGQSFKRKFTILQRDRRNIFEALRSDSKKLRS